MIWKCADFEFDTTIPVIMGVLNVTPDSFSDGGQHNTAEAAVEHAHKLIEQGAQIIDVGGESTRPGAAEIDPETEIARVLPVIEALTEEDVCVSIDTRHPQVALEALSAGASIINDVTGFTNEHMFDIAKNCDAGLVVMHNSRGVEVSGDIVAHATEFLRTKTLALTAAGVDPRRICVDPGPGFGKTAQQSLDVMRNITEFVHLGHVVMAAPSRKSYLTHAYKSLKDSKPEERDVASAAECLLAAELGAGVLRVHNVEITKAAMRDLRPRVILGIGCNQVTNEVLDACGGDALRAKKTMLNRAVGALSMLPDSELIDVSSYFESQPAYLEDQDAFLNGVVVLRCGESPRDLLQNLHKIEDELGRIRTVKNGPRTCDIDILDYQMYVYESEELTLPHPRINERDFVVKPLLEVLPGCVLANGHAVGSVPESDRVGFAKLAN